MPNTLAHLGVQGVVTKLAVPQVDPKIVFLGCLLPDVPWIIRRIVAGVAPGVDPYTLKLYAIVQASLFMTLVLCGSLAGLSRTPGRIFTIFATNSLFHLVLDAMQIKWANGVHLFAPFSWDLLNFGWFWPESLPTYLMTGFGLMYVIWKWKEALSQPLDLAPLSVYRIGYCVLGLTLYLTIPFVFLHDPFIQDNHYVRTFHEKDQRVNRVVEVDRRPYRRETERDVVNVFGEDFTVRGVGLTESGIASIRGRFVQSQAIEIREIHAHSTWFREWSSYIGIIILSIMWVIAIIRHVEIIPLKLRHTSKRSSPESL